MPWSTLFQDSKHQLRWPDENAVRFLQHTNRTRNGTPELALDLGCGWGRHIPLLQHYGYTVSAVDLSPTAITHAKTFGVQAIAGDTSRIPFTDNTFDIVIAIHSIYYGNRNHVANSIREIHRVLRDNGQALFTLRTIYDTRQAHPNPDEAKMTITYLDWTDIDEMAASFTTGNTELVSRMGPSYHYSDFYITATK